MEIAVDNISPTKSMFVLMYPEGEGGELEGRIFGK